MKKFKLTLAIALAAMVLPVVSCGAEEVPKYSEIVLGEDYLDLEAEIDWFHNRTDRSADGYLEDLIARFNETYPGIKVTESSTTAYADDYNMRLSSGEWGDIMMGIRNDLSLFPEYFHPIDDYDNLKDTIKWVEADTYEGVVYGIPMQGTLGVGVVYNKRVWEEAGITEIPRTPEDFLACLQQIKDNTDSIPLYTNYMDNSGMGAPWQALSIATTGDPTYYNQKLAKDADPFAQGNGIYDVLKIYYDAVSMGLTEDDFTATDWETSKAYINSGEAASTIIPAWYFSQAQAAGDTPEDVGYFLFPYLVDGTQYAQVYPERGFVINKKSSDVNKTASLIFIKWIEEESGWPAHEKAFPSMVGQEDQNPEDFDLNGAQMLVEQPALPGEESLLADMKEESTLLLSYSDTRPIVEAAASGSKTFDEIIDEMNEKWDEAQEVLGITPEY